MATLKAYGNQKSDAPLELLQIERREPLDSEVKIEILFCGVCHSDIHTARDEWSGTYYPCVPGHEIVGRVKSTGQKVQKFKVGDIVAVGCMVDSCRSCHNCQEHLEQYCDEGATFTYNSKGRADGKVTLGGYSQEIVVEESFVLAVPQKFHGKMLAAVAPLLCAGITTYSPLRHWGVSKGSKVGVVGLGGLGHMAIKIAAAMGAEVTLFTTSEDKIEDAKRLGAKDAVYSKDAAQMKSCASTLDFILNTVACSHNLDPYINLLKRDGTMCLLGAPEHPHNTPAFNALIFRRRQIGGSLIGGIKETQEMLDFCAEHDIVSDIELIKAAEINEAYERMIKGDVKYRFVIDIASL